MSEQRVDMFVEMAAQHGVSSEVHPLDDVFEFLFGNETFPSKDDAIRYYFDEGARSARQVAELISHSCKIVDRPYEMLDFASGFGFVTRHLGNVLPDATITASDIRRSAVRFTQSTLHVRSVVAAAVPEQLELQSSYDVVFALSFFSSLPKQTWARWLDALFEQVTVGGFLIFTTQGLLSRGYFEEPELDDDGFWFAPGPEQKNLRGEERGQTIVDPRFVIDKIYKHADRELVLFQQGAWWSHQDLYVLKRSD